MHSPLEGMERRHTAKISLRRLPELEFVRHEPWYNKDSPRTSTCPETNVESLVVIISVVPQTTIETTVLL